MDPILHDALTIFFIVAGLALLWLNLRDWRRHANGRAGQSSSLPEMGLVPVVTEPAEDVKEVAGPSDADIARSRAKAEECLGHAEQAAGQTDKEAWLRMAAKWIELIEEAERGGVVER